MYVCLNNKSLKKVYILLLLKYMTRLYFWRATRMQAPNKNSSVVKVLWRWISIDVDALTGIALLVYFSPNFFHGWHKPNGPQSHMFLQRPLRPLSNLVSPCERALCDVLSTTTWRALTVCHSSVRTWSALIVCHSLVCTYRALSTH